MIILDVEQGTTAWAMARVGVVTASQFDRILTPKTMRLSASADKYANELLFELHDGVPYDNATSGFMQRGSLQERKAVQRYELENDVETTPVGFVLRDDRRVGASPDRFIGTNGLVEFKCPAGPNHVGYLLDDEGIGYKAQCQGQLWICEREWIDTVSYCPGWTTATVRQQRDEKFIAALAAAVDLFLEELDQAKAKLIAKGNVFPDRDDASAAA